MFTLDKDMTQSAKELQFIAKDWERLQPVSRQRILEVMNCDKSEEFYKGALSAYYAAALLANDKNISEEAKPVLFQGAAALIASRLAYGEWPPQ